MSAQRNSVRTYTKLAAKYSYKGCVACLLIVFPTLLLSFNKKQLEDHLYVVSGKNDLLQEP
jgi:hypothetical protein